jgi:cysteine desulfurase family protein (TIGR01976 family)
MTQLTFDLSRALAKTWQPGDEVVVTRLDHDANIRPWLIAAESAGAVVRWAEFDPATGELQVENVAKVITPRTRLVAVTAASNLLGTRPRLSEITALARDVGALCFVDGVHFTAHAPVDVDAIGADLYACSPYKFLGPHCGVVAGRVSLLEQLRPDKLLPSTDVVPERFELGTLPYELLAGTTAAVEFLADLAPPAPTRRAQLVAAMSLVEEHEDRLRSVIEEGLATLPGVEVRSRATVRTPTLLLTFENRDPVEAYRFLAERDINVPAGSFYAIEASRFLGLGDAGGLRVGLAPYSSRSDVDRLLDALTEFTR